MRQQQHLHIQEDCGAFQKVAGVRYLARGSRSYRQCTNYPFALPFSFFGAVFRRVETCLAGGESDELETGQLSLLWQDCDQGGSGREVYYSRGCEVSELRQPESAEGGMGDDSCGSAEAAVFVSRLRSSFLLMLKVSFSVAMLRALPIVFSQLLSLFFLGGFFIE